MICAGLAFGWSGVATKLASDDLSSHHLVVAALWGLSTAAASAVGVLSEMSALQSRPAIQVAPVVFVTQTVVPVALAPVLFGERFGATPLGGLPLGVSLAVLIGGAALLARSPLLTLGSVPADGRRAGQRRQRLGAQPRRAQPRDDALEPGHRRRRSVELDHQHVARAHRGAEAAGSSPAAAARPSRALRRLCAEHQLADRQPAARLQVVEAVMQETQRAGLRAQHAARALPAQRPRARHFREQLIAQPAHGRDPRARRHARRRR